MILPRIGIGYDIHRCGAGRRCVLGGVEIPAAQGLVGHSDADVLLHALMDALLGAAALGDIGQHFPNTDSTYQDISSLELLRQVGEKIGAVGYRIGNVDVSLIAEAPTVQPFLLPMRQRIAEVLRIEPGCVGIKATTNERLGSLGRSEGIAALAVALLYPADGAAQ